MHFLEQQQAARQLTRRLVLLFSMGILCVTLAISAVMLTLAATLSNGLIFFRLPDALWLHAHPAAVISTVMLVWGVTGGAVLLKRIELRSGGGTVARALGGERIEGDSRDPLYKRLHNVVEEMAIAAGIAVPEVYVLPREAGINAFAAGLSPANAAIAVTRGALELLTRDELQGVVAHEFSHIVNGDIRLNQQLIAWLYGLMALSVLGRGLWRMSLSESNGRRSGFPPVLFAAASVMALGYIGMLFGRLIQAAVARRREVLADAAAIQYTRNPDGLRGALMKIAASSNGAQLREVSTDEFAHLLFFPPRSQWFATHPPIEDRVRSLGGVFDAAEIQRLRLSFNHADKIGVVESDAEHRYDNATSSLSPAASNQVVSLADIAYRPGALQAPQLQWAKAVRASLPAAITIAASQVDAAMALLLALAIGPDRPLREQQLVVVNARLGVSMRERVGEMLLVVNELQPVQRQPVLQLLLPQLRQLPTDHRVQLIGCLNAVLQCAGSLDISHYALCKLAQSYLHDAFADKSRRGARLNLAQAVDAITQLLSVLANAGHLKSEIAQPDMARQAYELALQHLGLRQYAPLAHHDDWQVRLDHALLQLDQLQPMAKQMLIEAMLIAVAHDQQLNLQELELLRMFSACLHFPLPLPLAVTQAR